LGPLESTSQSLDMYLIGTVHQHAACEIFQTIVLR
jgi:hypothetical protein